MQEIVCEYYQYVFFSWLVYTELRKLERETRVVLGQIVDNVKEVRMQGEKTGRNQDLDGVEWKALLRGQQGYLHHQRPGLSHGGERRLNPEIS